jgi:hypothetical protein
MLEVSLSGVDRSIYLLVPRVEVAESGGVLVLVRLVDT